MARVRDIEPSELAPELAAIYEEFAGAYGPFRNQVAVFAHVPAALKHLMPLLMELRAAKTLPKRYLELAFVAVEGVSLAGAERILDYRGHPELDETDRLVVEYAIAVTERPNRLPDPMFARLRHHFSEAQIVELTLRIALCGFFNRFNDALQIEEEAAAAVAALG